tara:strand:- start:182 stop:499 length:318 start_codon:yes stop_codon:yes gene_type:complete
MCILRQEEAWALLPHLFAGFLRSLTPFCYTVILRYSAGMDKPSVFSHNRFLGDKRTQQVYDLEEVANEEDMSIILDELLSAETFLCFSPDTLAEARNRGYRLQVV